MAPLSDFPEALNRLATLVGSVCRAVVKAAESTWRSPLLSRVTPMDCSVVEPETAVSACES